MGSYCTVRDVRTALTPNAVETAEERPETAAGLPDWQIEDAILEAEGVVNSYIATRYTITPIDVTNEANPDADPPAPFDPFKTAPSPLRGWTRDIAAYLATLTHRQNKDIGDDDPVRLRFNLVMGFLKDVRDRSMNLPLPVADATDDQGVYVENLYEGRMFGLDDVGLGYEGRSSQRFIPRYRDV